MDSSDRALTEQNQLFQGVDFTTVEYMLEYCTVRNLAAGDKLLQPDVPSHHLYLILSGKLSVRLPAHESVEHAALGAGECAGEISLVDGKHPSALVVAAEPTRVLAVPHDTVWSLVDHSHAIARNLLSIVAGRMRNDKRALITSNDTKKQFEQQAYVDALTGVHNRHWMIDAFPRALHRCVLNKSPCSIMMADIDFFKRVNDTHGHLVGDVTLKMVARCITNNLRPHDLFARYGGEEFALLLPDTDTQNAQLVAERLRKKIAETTIQRDDITFQVTVSIGITPTQRDEQLETLLGEADQALYRAKERGRNRVEVFS